MAECYTPFVETRRSFFFYNFKWLFDKNISIQLAYKILANFWTCQQGDPVVNAAIDNWGNMHRHEETWVNS